MTKQEYCFKDREGRKIVIALLDDRDRNMNPSMLQEVTVYENTLKLVFYETGFDRVGEFSQKGEPQWVGINFAKWLGKIASKGDN